MFKNNCLNQSNFSSGFAAFKPDRKNNFWVFQCSFLRLSLFWQKREVFSELSRKCYKTTEEYSLKVLGSFWGVKKFSLIFSLFNCFVHKCCLQLIQICLWICPFSNLLRKTNFPSISELLSERVIFWLKREVFIEFPRKCFKTTGNHSLAVCGSFCREKQLLLIFVPF